MKSWRSIEGDDTVPFTTEIISNSCAAMLSSSALAALAAVLCAAITSANHKIDSGTVAP